EQRAPPRAAVRGRPKDRSAARRRLRNRPEGRACRLALVEHPAAGGRLAAYLAAVERQEGCAYPERAAPRLDVDAIGSVVERRQAPHRPPPLSGLMLDLERHRLAAGGIAVGDGDPTPRQLARKTQRGSPRMQP